MQHNKQNWLLWLLPTPGNIIFTLLIISGVLWAQSAGAITLGVINAPTTSTTTIPYQGRLTDSSGNPVSGPEVMIFRLYNQDESGTALWEESHAGEDSVLVESGLFNVILGNVNPLEQGVITENNPLYLGITIGTNPEMSPRVQLGAVPYAVHALSVADGSITQTKLSSNVRVEPPDGSITTVKLADGSVTQAKLSSDMSLESSDGSITTAKLADGSVTQSKLSSTVQVEPPDGSVTTTKLTNGSVTKEKLDSNGMFRLLGEKTCESCSDVVETKQSGFHDIKGESDRDLMEVTVTSKGGMVLVSMTGSNITSTPAGRWCAIAVYQNGALTRFVHLNGRPLDVSTEWGCSASYMFTDLPAGTYTFKAQAWVSEETTITWLYQRQILVFEF